MNYQSSKQLTYPSQPKFWYLCTTTITQTTESSQVRKNELRMQKSERKFTRKVLNQHLAQYTTTTTLKHHVCCAFLTKTKPYNSLKVIASLLLRRSTMLWLFAAFAECFLYIQLYILFCILLTYVYLAYLHIYLPKNKHILMDIFIPVSTESLTHCLSQIFSWKWSQMLSNIFFNFAWKHS